VLDGLDEQDEIDAAWFDLGVAQRRLMDVDATPGRDVGSTGVGLDALQRPSGLTEPAEEVEVEPIAAADVDDQRISREVTCGPQHPTGFEPAPHIMDEPEAFLGEVERVIVGWVDAFEFGFGGTGVEKHEAACRAANDEKGVRTRPVLEVLTDTDGLDIARPTDVTHHRLGRELVTVSTRARGEGAPTANADRPASRRVRPRSEPTKVSFEPRSDLRFAPLGGACGQGSSHRRILRVRFTTVSRHVDLEPGEPLMPQPRVAILGAGLAGLVAAHELRRFGIDSTVFEASPRIAGLATSERDEDGFAFDVGAHFLTNRLAAAVGIAGQCRRVQQYGEAVHRKGKNASYPLGLMTNPRYALSAAAAMVAKHDEPTDARTWFRQTYGKALADDIAIPLVEAWSGADAGDLAASVGGNIPSSILHTLFLRGASRVSRRAVALGYSHEAPENAGVFHVYPEEGVATLCAELAASSGAEIRLETPVEAIHVDDGAVTGVSAGGEEFPADLVVSTAPVSILPRLVQGSSVLDDLVDFRYRPMVFVNVKLEGRGLLPDVVTWTPESHFPFFRLTEAPLSMPLQAPPGKTMITADIGCERDDEIWSASDDELHRLCLDALTPIVPDIDRRDLGARVSRTPIAYPVYLSAYEDRRQAFSEDTRIDGLLSVGRNGEFAHILMEDVYWRTRREISSWAQDHVDRHVGHATIPA